MLRFDYGVDRKFLVGQLSWFVVWVIVTAIGAYLTPSSQGHGTHQQLGLPPCPSVFMFGRLCPGCGMTTAFSATIKGDFATAWNANPFGTLGYFLFTISAILAIYGWIKGIKIDTNTKPYNIGISILIGSFILFGAYRFFLMPVFSTP
jgi:hypothetical protein